MQVYQAIPSLLHRHGVRHIFGMLGGSNVNWVAEGVGSGMFDLIKTRHEETAVHGAIGYARSSGQLGVCTVTRGPGFANALNGLISASVYHVPLLLIVGESPSSDPSAPYTEQVLPQAELAATLGIDFTNVTTIEGLETAIGDVIHRAYETSTPQILSISRYVIGNEITLSDEPAPAATPIEPDPQAVDAVVKAIEASKQPLILAGQGASLSGAREALIELAELTGARLATSLRANKMFSGHPSDLGLCGSWAPSVVKDLFAETDLVIAFGASLNPRTTYEGQMFDGAKIAQCEVNPDRPIRASDLDLAILGDARLTAEALAAQWQARGNERRQAPAPAPSHADRQQSVLDVDLGHDPTRGLDLRQALAAWDAALPADRIVITDSGRTVGVTATMVDAHNDRSWLVGNSYGCVGLGIGLSVGAAIANPQRPVTLICGDGGFMMAAAGLDTIRLHQLNVSIFILNDEQLGSEMRYLQTYDQPPDVVRQPLPHLADLTRAYGGTSQTVTDPSEFASLRYEDGLQIVDVRLDPLVHGSTALG